MEIGKEVLKAAYFDDIPLAFRLSVDTGPKETYYGPYAETLINFAHYEGYDLRIESINETSKSQLIEKLEKGVFDISLMGSAMRFSDKVLRFSYPLETLHSCIMVPLPLELPKFYYVVRPFAPYIWVALLLSIFYIGLLKTILELKSKITKSAVEKNILIALAMVTFTANMHLKFRKVYIREMIFYSLIFLFGFILSSYHASHMTAYNMKPVCVKPIETLEDLVKSKLRILISESLNQEHSPSSSVDFQLIHHLFSPIAPNAFHNILKRFDRSVAYVVSQHQWTFLNRQQRTLIQPYFGLTDICFETFLNSYPIERNALRAQQLLDQFILKVQQSGLWIHWEETAFQAAKSVGEAKYLLDTYPVERLNMEFFRFAWGVLAVGLPLSCLGLVLEYYLHKESLWKRYRRFESRGRVGPEIYFRKQFNF